jgi:O2-independent ubiquinone biosynthesis protein UbiV
MKKGSKIRKRVLSGSTTGFRINFLSPRSGEKKIVRNDVKGRAALILGPLFFHWPEEKWRDFYFRIADEAEVDCVYVGEVVCSKREPFVEKYYDEVIRRLMKAGKEVVLSTLAMVTTPCEMDSIKQKAKGKFLVEANDLAAVQVLVGKKFVVGPFINTINEGARDYFVKLGARRIVLPVELCGEAIGVLANGSAALRGCADGKARGCDPALPFPEIEVQVFGRQALSVAMRCYAARAAGRTKDNCRYACGYDPDGLAADAFDGKPVLTVNGTMTMSHGYVVLLRELKRLRKQGVTHFRLSPQDVDMVRVAALYRGVLDGKMEAESAQQKLRKIVGKVPFINGYFYGREGLTWVE